MNKVLLAQVSSWVEGRHYYKTTDDGKVAYLSGLNAVFQNVLAVAAGAAGLVCFVMLIIGGFQYMTAGGDQKALAKAKMTLTWTIIGLVVLIGGWFILNLVVEITGIETLKQFSVPEPVSAPLAP